MGHKHFKLYKVELKGGARFFCENGTVKVPAQERDFNQSKARITQNNVLQTHSANVSATCDNSVSL